MDKVQDIQFFDAEGHKSVVQAWEAVFEHAQLGLKAAVCYATAPGIAVLSKAARKIAYGDGFFVASVEYPTNIDALAGLHEMAKGHVYIHLGFDSPRTNDEVQQDGYALMHSKVLLAEGFNSMKLWVGSHNLTARALAGANLEAGMLVTGDCDTKLMHDARKHLLVCRDSAERFDPARIKVYKHIQRRRMRSPIEVQPSTILVIHAEADEPVRQHQLPNVVHLCLKPHQLDNYFAMDREVRLFLHPPGSLKPGKQVDLSNATGWMGRQTSITRTELHPRNQGVEGSFDAARFQVFIEDRSTPPKALPTDVKLDGMTTQVVMRFSRVLRPGAETYSIRTGTSSIRMKTIEEKPSPEPIDPRLADSFSHGSIKDGVLRFERITDIEPKVHVQAYAASLQPLNVLGAGDVAFSYSIVEPMHPIDPYFFITKNVVRVWG
ncbi:MAG: hypothetical protein IPK70_06235 [Flavobacteriales bacterium]|nr:hypothetical protein [Flavobacteriales bacterium]